MLCHFTARTGYNEAGQRRDIEGVLTIAARTNNVQHFVTVQVYRYAKLQECITETQQLIYCNAAHQENGHESSQFAFIEHAFGNADENIFGRFAGEGLMFEKVV